MDFKWILMRLGGLLGTSWGVLGASWRVLGASWGVLGASCRVLGFLEASWAVLEASWAPKPPQDKPDLTWNGKRRSFWRLALGRFSKRSWIAKAPQCSAIFSRKKLQKSIPKPPKIEPKTLQSRGLEGIPLEIAFPSQIDPLIIRSWGCLGASWGRLGRVLGPSWSCLGASWGVLGGS